MAGRKSKYWENIAPCLDQVTEMAKTMTEKQMAEYFGVAYSSTWHEYKKKYPEFVEAIKKGRRCLVSDLRGALIKKALGYEYTETKQVVESVRWDEDMYQALIDAGFTPEQISGSRMVRTETSFKKMAPDVAAINLALKNYDPKNWANDPQMLELRKKELELKKKQIENSQW